MPTGSDPLGDNEVDSTVRPERPVRRSTTRGMVSAAVLCVALGFYSALLVYGSLLIGFVSDSCGLGKPCDVDQLNFAVILGVIGCFGVAVGAIVITILRGRRNRAFTWLVPSFGILVATALFLVASTVGYAAAGIDFWNR